jgi:hypothetical protein
MIHGRAFRVAPSPGSWHESSVTFFLEAASIFTGGRGFLCGRFGLESLDLGDGESDLSADMQGADFVICAPSAERHAGNFPPLGKLGG